MDCDEAIAEYEAAIDEAREARVRLRNACFNLRMMLNLLYVPTIIFVSAFIAWMFCSGWLCRVLLVAMVVAFLAFAAALAFVYRYWDTVGIERHACKALAGKVQQKWLQQVVIHCPPNARPPRVWIDCDC